MSALMTSASKPAAGLVSSCILAILAPQCGCDGEGYGAPCDDHIVGLGDVINNLQYKQDVYRREDLAVILLNQCKNENKLTCGKSQMFIQRIKH